MNSSDKPQFDEQIALLCAGYNVPVSVRPEAYWKGLEKMSIVELARCVEFALGEDGPDKIPTTKDLWNIRKQLRVHRAPPQKIEAVTHESTGLRLVNGLFLQFLSEKRLGQNFKGDLHVMARRRECLDLAEWLDGLIAEDMLPTPLERQRAFDAAMARV